MQALDCDYRDFESSQKTEADKTLLVKFHYKSVQDFPATSEAGRPIFKEREYINIRIPGQQDEVSRPAKIDDKQRFPRHYEAFKQRIEMPLEGTPLVEWPAINRSLADQLAFQGIKTVEQMAGLNDNNMGAVHGMQSLKQKAKDWLDSTKDDGVLSKLRDELVARDATISEQQAQLAAVMSRLEALEEVPKPSKKGK